MKIVFLGTGEIGLPALEALADSSDHDLLAVFTQPDKPFGRKGELKPPAPKAFAEGRGIPVHQPAKIRSSESMELLEGYLPEVVVVVAYGQILPESVLDLPPVACLNLHASILPQHRGAAPIQAAILAGDRETGMAVMYMDVGLDTGDVLLVRKLELAEDETGGSLHDRLAELGPEALLEALDLLARGETPRTPQDHALATHTGKLDRGDGAIDWLQPAGEIERRVRAFDPWPGTSSAFPDGAGFKLFPAVEVLSELKGDPGEVLESGRDGIVVACGEGALRITELQPAGKRRMTAAAYLAGRDLPTGSILR